MGAEAAVAAAGAAAAAAKVARWAGRGQWFPAAHPEGPVMRLPIIDADGHVLELFALWPEPLPARYLRQAPLAQIPGMQSATKSVRAV